MNGKLYGKTFYACLVNEGHREEAYPFRFQNQYELAEEAVFHRVFQEFLQDGLKSEPFVHDKLGYLGKQPVYQAAIYYDNKREAGKYGEYGKWEFRRETSRTFCPVHRLAGSEYTIARQDTIYALKYLINREM